MNPDGGQASRAAAGLMRGLTAEAALLGDLRSGLLEQRDALARDDTDALQAVVQQIGRTLLALRESRRHRIDLIEMLSGRRNVALSALSAHLEPTERAPYQAACQELHRAAALASRDLVINQAVLRRAIEEGERLLQRVLTAPDGLEAGAYSAAAPTSASAPAGLLLNQRA